MIVSERALKFMFSQEIISESYYRRRLRAPYWPKGRSGVTIGIGYDLGHQTREQAHKDLGKYYSEKDVDRLCDACHVTGPHARGLANEFKSEGIALCFVKAFELHHELILPRYVRLTEKAFPGCLGLNHDTQGMLLSLVYNRGGSMRGSRRKEMRFIRDYVKLAMYDQIANEIRSMKRIWPLTSAVGRGLRRRRDLEADIVETSERHYTDGELVHI